MKGFSKCPHCGYKTYLNVCASCGYGATPTPILPKNATEQDEQNNSKNVLYDRVVIVFKKPKWWIDVKRR